MSQPASIQLLPLKGGDVNVMDVGVGPTVVAIHGAPGGVQDFHRLAHALGGSARLVAVDLPGFGRSPLAPGERATIERCVEAVREVIGAVAGGPVVLLGHSYGGHIALRVADRERERVRGVAVVASAGLSPHAPLRRTPFGLVRWLLTTPLRAVFLPLLKRAFKASGLPAHDEAVTATVSLLPDTDFAGMRALVARLDLPCLAVWATDDPLIEAPISQALAEALPPGPRVAMDGGHGLPITRARPLAEALIPFVHSVLG